MKSNNAKINTRGGKGSYIQGKYVPKNPEKYAGDINKCIYRSGWEKDFMVMCDENPGVSSWACEPFHIQYFHPLEKKYKIYWIDFIVQYIDTNGRRKIDLIEIKPENETFIEKAKTKKNKIAVIINHAKWKAAAAFAKQNGLNFRVLGETMLYGNRRL